jgi:hypothetical protein
MQFDYDSLKKKEKALAHLLEPEPHGILKPLKSGISSRCHEAQAVQAGLDGILEKHHHIV